MSGYTISTIDRLGSYWSQFTVEIVIWIKLISLALLMVILCTILIKRKKDVFRKGIYFLEVLYYFVFVYEIFLCVQQDSDWNLRYIVVWTIVGFLLVKQRSKIYFWFGLMPGFVGYVATICISVVGIVGAYRAMFAAAFGAIVIMASSEPFQKIEDGTYSNTIRRVAVSMIVATFAYLLFCCIVFIRASNRPQNICEYNCNVIEQGPLKEILFPETEMDCYNSLLAVSEQYVNDGDKLCHIGINEMVYLMREGNIEMAIPSTVWNDWT